MASNITCEHISDRCTTCCWPLTKYGKQVLAERAALASMPPAPKRVSWWSRIWSKRGK